MTRYWFQFEIDDASARAYASWARVRGGCGVTARDYMDACAVLREKLFGGDPFPLVLVASEDPPPSELPTGATPAETRGVWFPV
jgi:hypothetical protein